MKRAAVVLALVALTLGACGGGGDPDGAVTTSPGSGGGDDQDATATTVPAGADTTVAADPQDDAGNAPVSGSTGVITVDGASVDAQVFRCQPISIGSEPHEDDLAIVAFIGGSGGLNVDVSHSSRVDMNTGQEYLRSRVDLLYSTSGAEGTIQFEGVARSDVDGSWLVGEPESTAESVPTAPVVVDGNKLTGGMTLPQSWPEGGTGAVDIAFDLDIPSDFHPDC